MKVTSSASSPDPTMTQVCHKIVDEEHTYETVTYIYDEWFNSECPWITENSRWIYDDASVIAVVKRKLTDFHELELGDTFMFQASYAVPKGLSAEKTNLSD